ncbi:trifunctional dihydropteroate synthetase [Ascosphaera acerosa]|nr:trifunctional dihydropteroate synthetase [Ascosphaera acerosa]
MQLRSYGATKHAAVLSENVMQYFENGAEDEMAAWHHGKLAALGEGLNGGAGRAATAYIALGSNMGDRLAMLERSLQLMEAQGIHVTRTSSLYETAPMYATDQDPFLNGVCEIETDLAPIDLLNALQSIENEMGRVKIIDKGPRVIDLDVLLYNDITYSDARLTIPHKLMLEREFVLRPLCQLIPNKCPPVPDAPRPYQSILKCLPPAKPRPISMTPVSPRFPAHLNASDPARATHVMAVLNVTPDSFSDGGQHSPTDLQSLADDVRRMIRAGATIIDIGGESTRPSSTPVGAEEEIRRVLPAIKMIRSMPEAACVAISIDTYRASVAEAAVAAGADIINDISAGTLDPEMFPTMARLGTTVILMHMRGTPQTMVPMTTYDNNDVIAGVGKELLERVEEAQRAGIRRWRIILDPGIGFAKTAAQNLQLLRHGAALRQYEGLSGLPWLWGTSRKSFIGKATGVTTASERVWGTAATVTAAVQAGADIVRVHDVAEMVQVASMADAIYRVPQEV